MRKKTQALTLGLSTLAVGLGLVLSATYPQPAATTESTPVYYELSGQPPSVDTSGLKSQKRIEMLYTEEEVIACAKLIYGEYGADWVSDSEKAKVVCTLVNRTWSAKWVNYVGSSELMAQLTYPSQFYYIPSFPCTDRHYRVAYDVLWRASQIAQGCEGIAWETNALSYWGDGNINHFY